MTPPSLKGFCTSVIHSVLFGEIKETKTFTTSITLKLSFLVSRERQKCKIGLNNKKYRLKNAKYGLKDAKWGQKTQNNQKWSLKLSVVVGVIKEIKTYSTPITLKGFFHIVNLSVVFQDV